MFWKKRAHPLPKFPPHAADTFRELCVVLSKEELTELAALVEENFTRAAELKSRFDSYDLQSAENLTSVCRYLIDRYYDFPPEKQKLIIGAIRYFAVSDDPFNDTTFASGFHDDKCIMNYVLEEIGIEDQYLLTH